MQLVGNMGTLEGLLIQSRWGSQSHYRLIDAAFLESQTDRHELASAATMIPRENVRFYEELRDAPVIVPAALTSRAGS
jgi:hypothetical protein